MEGKAGGRASFPIPKLPAIHPPTEKRRQLTSSRQIATTCMQWAVTFNRSHHFSSLIHRFVSARLHSSLSLSLGHSHTIRCSIILLFPPASVSPSSPYTYRGCWKLYYAQSMHSLSRRRRCRLLMVTSTRTQPSPPLHRRAAATVRVGAQWNCEISAKAAKVNIYRGGRQ